MKTKPNLLAAEGYLDTLNPRRGIALFETQNETILAAMPLAVAGFNIRNRNKQLAIVHVNGKAIGVVQGKTIFEALRRAHAQAAFRKVAHA